MPVPTTIVALSSGAVPSGIAVIRISGPGTKPALTQIAGVVPEPRKLVLRRLKDRNGRELDTGFVVYFEAPHSFTGEDSAELQVHGSRAVIAGVLDTLCRQTGVELATAGDFTRRAFESGRLDLTQVEGLGDLIAAETEGQRRLALERSEGLLSKLIGDWRLRLVDLRAEIEARLDFSDEGDVAENLPEGFGIELAGLEHALKETLATFTAGRITRDGFRVVIAGAPNAGKSSLLNALAGSDEAIVSPEEGTTRDVKEVQLDLGGQLIRLYDVAGLRLSASLVESEGVRRAEKAISQADLVLWLEAPDVVPIATPPSVENLWRLVSKSDLGGAKVESENAVSARTGQGIAALKQRLRQAAGEAVGDEAMLISRLRDKESIERALGFLAKAKTPGLADELVAENLRLCGQALARVTGEIDAEEVLDRLFAGFCIGK